VNVSIISKTKTGIIFSNKFKEFQSKKNSKQILRKMKKYETIVEIPK
jgi:hypothetical protein